MSDERKSMISGSGYGSNHCWNGHTPQDNSKRTIYTCEDCPASFVHHYDAMPDIFTAMQQAGVPESCGDRF